MSNPSPDLITDLGKLLKQAQEAKHTLHHYRAEVQVAQNELEHLKTNIDNQTENLIVQQTKKLKAVRRPLKLDIEQCHKTLKLVKAELEEVVSQETVIRQNIDLLTTELTNTQMTLTDVAQAVIDTNIALDASRGLIVSLQADKLQLEQGNQALIASESMLKESIDALTTKKQTIQEQLLIIEDDYTEKIADKEQMLKLLNAKLLKVSQQVEERQQIDESTRDGLASRVQILDDREQNLRIREAKVEQGEDKLIQNSNLMSL